MMATYIHYESDSYLIGVFCNLGDMNRWISAVIIFVLSLVLLFAIYGIGCLFTKGSRTANEKITTKELEEYGLHANISSLSAADVDKIIDAEESKDKGGSKS